MSPAHTRSLKILIIDDDEDIREIALMCLELDVGFTVRTADGGREGLLVARHWQPDLILLDIIMPDIDGPTTVKRLALDPQTRHIPVVFLSARIDTEEIVRTMSLGIVGVIAKPFDPMALPQLVRGYATAKR